MPDKIKRYLTASFLLTLLLGYWICIFGFTHVHIIDGVQIVHSHPFTESGEHNHTKSELVILADIAHACHFISTDSYFDFLPYYPLETEIFYAQYVNHRECKNTISFLRGPPGLL